MKNVVLLGGKKCIISDEIFENDIQKSYKMSPHTSYIRLNKTHLVWFGLVAVDGSHFEKNYMTSEPHTFFDQSAGI